MAVDPRKYAEALRNSRNKSDAYDYYMRIGGDLRDSADLNTLLAAEPSSAFGGGGGGGGIPPPPSTRSLDLTNILESRKGTSKIADIGASDSIDALKFLDARLPPTEKMKMIQSEILNQLQRESNLYTEISEKTGLQGDLLRGYTDSIAESSVNALKFGYNIEQVTNMVTKMSEDSGKFNIVSKETLDRSYATGRAFVGSLSELGRAFGEFQKVGIGAKNTLDAIDKAGRSSMSLGLNSKKTTEMLRTDLGKLNEYGFSNGVEGLNRMVQRSLEFRMNMGEVFKIADKVMDPAGAIEMTANMQMLGGAIGDLNDPLKLMYMATNNVEGLQDAMMGAVENLATYNEEQQRFEVTGINLRRVREMANAMGVDYKELTKGAIAAQERMMTLNGLMGKGFDLTEKDQEFITNLAQMKDGRMVIELPNDVAKKLGSETTIAIDDLTEKQITELQKYQDELVKMNPEEIAQGQFTTVKNIENMMKSLVQMQVRDLAISTLGAKEGAKADVGKIMRDLGIEDSLKTLTERQMGGEKGGLSNITSGVISGVEGIIDRLGIDNLLKSMFQTVAEKLKETVNSGISSEAEKKLESKKTEYEKSEPVTFNHKHEFRIIGPFGTDQQGVEYKGSYTQSEVMV